MRGLERDCLFDGLGEAGKVFLARDGDAAELRGNRREHLEIKQHEALPAQMLDHATGYLMAFGAMMAKARQSREGGSWHVRVSLAQTGRWLWNLGRVADGFKTEDLKADDITPFIEDTPSGFGPLGSVSHSAELSKTPAFWARPAMPLGSHPPQWPARQ